MLFRKKSRHMRPAREQSTGKEEYAAKSTVPSAAQLRTAAGILRTKQGLPLPRQPLQCALLMLFSGSSVLR